MSQKEFFFKIAFRRIIIFAKLLLSGFKVALKKSYFQDNTVRGILILSALANLGLWIYLFANKISGPYPVILHYSLLSGVDYLGEYYKIFSIPLVGLILFLGNGIVGYWLYSREKLATYFLIIATLEIQIFLFIAGAALIRINS